MGVFLSARWLRVAGERHQHRGWLQSKTSESKSKELHNWLRLTTIKGELSLSPFPLSLRLLALLRLSQPTDYVNSGWPG